jgi:Concanavalin A-like lectin/glucanases superfamily
MNRRTGAVATTAALLLVGLPLTVGEASASTGVLNLELNDSSGASIAVDSSGHHHNGQVGSRVKMGGGHATFPVEPNGTDLGSAPLVKVPDAGDGSLDPGQGTFTVVVRYRSTHSNGNLVQKGQHTSPGGQVKLEQVGSKLSCKFLTASGTATAGSGSVRMDNGAWHTVRCVRTATSVTMYVDGKQTRRTSRRTGNLNNTMPWTVGGKPNCNGSTVGCDYFTGDVDYLRLTKG